LNDVLLKRKGVVKMSNKSKIGKNIDFPANQFVVSAIDWLGYSIFQGNRLLNAFKEKHKMARFEEEVFVFALDRAIFMLKISTYEYSEMQIFLDKVEYALGKGNVKDVRDMRTHIDAYLEGKGKNQNNFIFEAGSIVSVFEGLVLDVTTTIVTDDSYIIGGKINVQKAIQVMEEILPQVERFCGSC